jgi:hypothetical protein
MTNFEQELRHRRRNPKCKMKLPKPVENPTNSLKQRKGKSKMSDLKSDHGVVKAPVVKIETTDHGIVAPVVYTRDPKDDLSPTPDAPWGWAISRKGTRYKLPRPRTEAEKEAARGAIAMIAVPIMKRLPFDHCGLSDRTIEALVKHGMDAPERLLFMSEREIEKIPGIGKASIAEIWSYRERFVGEVQKG